MKVLLLGAGSFAARGLAEALEAAGHNVWTLDRGIASESRLQQLKGDLSTLAYAARAAGAVDAIINFVVLKGQSIAANLAYCEKLANLLEKRGARFLIHISSVSVFPRSCGTVNESTPPASNWSGKGEYSKIKIVTELWLREHVEPARLVVVRPGFLLGTGLVDPIVGIGKMLPGGRMLGLGVAKSVVPLIDRRHLHRALERLLRLGQGRTPPGVLLVAPNSPTRGEYLEFCARGLGMVAKPLHFSRLVWIGALAGASVSLAIVKRRRANLIARLAHNLGRRIYDCSATEQLLGFSFKTDWQKVLLESDAAQRLNYTIPFHEPIPLTLSLSPSGGEGVRRTGLRRAEAASAAQAGEGESYRFSRSANGNQAEPVRVLYIGLGRVAHERHLPALEALDSDIEVDWWDPYVAKASYKGGLRLRKVADPAESKARHAVVVSPAATRAEVLTALPPSVERVLCEKPLVSRSVDWDRVTAAVNGRQKCYALHNYRFKPNVSDMASFLHRFNSGRLEHARIDFDSPPVALDGARWLREERPSRTLLMDYALHFLDLPLAFCDGPAVIRECESKHNARGETAAIYARLGLGNGHLEVNIRQGTNERKCQLTFVFHNYTCHLRFFPEAFFATFAKHSFLDDAKAAWAVARGTWNKLREKARWSRPEPSHQRVLGAFLGYYPEDTIDALQLSRVENIYRTALALERIVYEEPEPSSFPVCPSTFHC